MTAPRPTSRLIKAQPFGGYGANPHLHPIYAALVWVVAVMVMVLGQGLAAIPGAMVFGLDLGIEEDPVNLLYVLVAMFGFGAVLSLLWVRFVENRPLASIGLRKEAALKRFARGLALGLGFCAVVVLTIFMLGGYNIVALAPVLKTPSALIMIMLIFVGFIIQGSTEEILMRGWVMSAMAARFGLVIAIVVNSTVFAALHLGNEGIGNVNWIAMANIVLLGVFLSVYAVREGSLLGVCGWHGAWNWILGLGFGLDVSGMSIDTPALIIDLDNKAGAAQWLTGGSFGPEGSVIVSLVLLAGIAWVGLQKKGYVV